MTQKVLSDQVTSWRPSEDSRLDSRLEFELILREHQAYVTRLAHRLLGWSGDVEDVVQDVFVAVMEHRSRFCGRSSLRTWITSITVNRCRQYRRRQRLLSKWFSRAQRQTRLSCNDNPDDILDEQEQTARLQQAMATLPIRYRDVLVLRYL